MEKTPSSYSVHSDLVVLPLFWFPVYFLIAIFQVFTPDTTIAVGLVVYGVLCVIAMIAYYRGRSRGMKRSAYQIALIALYASYVLPGLVIGVIYLIYGGHPDFLR